jgi:hypothetical protein
MEAIVIRSLGAVRPNPKLVAGAKYGSAKPPADANEIALTKSRREVRRDEDLCDEESRDEESV